MLIKSGDTFRFTAPAGGVTKSIPVILSSGMLVIPVNDADAGDTVTGDVVGVHNLPKKAATAFQEGQPCYWDATNSEVTDDTALQYIGECRDVGGKAGADSYVRVALAPPHMQAASEGGGEVLQLTAPTGGVTEDIPLMIGDLFVIPLQTVAATNSFFAHIGGRYTLAKDTSTAFVEGQACYWNGTNIDDNPGGAFIGHCAVQGDVLAATAIMLVALSPVANRGAGLADMSLVTLTAPAGGVTIGVPTFVDTLPVIPLESIAATNPFKGLVPGMIAWLDKNTADVFAEGQAAYIDTGASELVDTVTPGAFVGWCCQEGGALATDAQMAVAVCVPCRGKVDAFQFFFEGDANATLKHDAIAPKDLAIHRILLLAGAAPTSAAGTITLAVASGGNNLLAGATFDMESLVADTVNNLALTATAADLDLAALAAIEFTCVSDNADAVDLNVQIMIEYVRR